MQHLPGRSLAGVHGSVHVTRPFCCQLCPREIDVAMWLAQFSANRWYSLQWRHNERDGVSNHRCLDGLHNRLFRRWSRKTSKLSVTGLCGEFTGHRWIPSCTKGHNTGNVSIWWRHHVNMSRPELNEWNFAEDMHVHERSLSRRVLLGITQHSRADPGFEVRGGANGLENLKSAYYMYFN